MYQLELVSCACILYVFMSSKMRHTRGSITHMVTGIFRHKPKWLVYMDNLFFEACSDSSIIQIDMGLGYHEGPVYFCVIFL